jgi:hypothetical protein
MPRFRVTSLIVFVALIAGGLGAMRYASEILAKGAVSIVFVATLVGLTGAMIVRNGSWIGFAVFLFVGYAAPSSFLPEGGDLGGHAIEAIAKDIHPNRTSRPVVPNVSPNYALMLAPEYERSFVVQNLDYGIPMIAGALSPDNELNTLKEYQRVLRAYFAQADLAKEKQAKAAQIGNACLALALGWVGAIIGRSLEKRRLASPPSRPLDREPTTTP